MITVLCKEAFKEQYQNLGDDQVSICSKGSYMYRVSQKTLLKEKLITSLRTKKRFFGTPGIMIVVLLTIYLIHVRVARDPTFPIRKNPSNSVTDYIIFNILMVFIAMGLDNIQAR